MLTRHTQTKSYLFNFLSSHLLLGYIIFFVILLTAACSFKPVVSVETMPSYDAVFERHKGWTGADGVYSVALTDNQLLWLFGDTWYGEVRDNRHVNAVIVKNSIAIQHGGSILQASINFHIGRTPAGRPRAFFRAADGRGWLWPYDAVRIGPALYLFLVQVERTATDNSFGFAVVDSWLGAVANPGDAPLKWRISQSRIPWGRFTAGGDTLYGSALLKQGPYIYIYGTTEDIRGKIRRKSMILARVLESQLNRFDQWRFYDNGRWSEDARDASRLCSEMANEYSVSFVESIGRYVVVYTENGFSKFIAVRFAPDPWGPWSRPIRVYTCPEAAISEDLFCYAAKGQPDLSSAPGELIVSYIANSLDFQTMADDASLYRPRFLRLRFHGE
jgi:hypothetical protein